MKVENANFSTNEINSALCSILLNVKLRQMDPNLTEPVTIQLSFQEQLRRHLSASQIQRLTGWAHRYSPALASMLFYCILNHLLSVPIANKVLSLYLLDALLKAALKASHGNRQAAEAYVPHIRENLDQILSAFLSPTPVPQTVEYAGHLMQVRKVVGLWMSKHGSQLPLSALENWDRKLWEVLESMPQHVITAAVSTTSLSSSTLAPTASQQPPAAQHQSTLDPSTAKDPSISAITRKMEEDRDRQKRAREETWALKTGTTDIDILNPAVRRAMEDEEFSQLWKCSTAPGLLPEDFAWMRDYRQRAMDAVTERSQL